MRTFARKSKRAGYADDSCCIVLFVILISAAFYLMAVVTNKNHHESQVLIIDRLLAKGETEISYVLPLVKYDFIFEGVKVQVDGGYTTLTGPAKRVAEILAIIYDVEIKTTSVEKE